MLKKISNAILEPLSIARHKSIETSTVPNCMNIAKVVPILKKGDHTDLNNYSPIAILPVISKILEKVIHRRLYSFLQSGNILFKSQHGFCKGNSTKQALIELTSMITKGMDDNKFTLGVFLDLSKAFDTINHQKLLRKVEYYGIRGYALEGSEATLIAVCNLWKSLGQDLVLSRNSMAFPKVQC